jgi:hypothetical protein
MKNLFRLLLLVCPFALFAQSADDRPDPKAWPAQSRAAAEKSLGTLRALAAANPIALGLKSADEATNATLAEPRIVSFIRLDSLRAYTSGASIEVLLVPQKILYPVKLQGQVRTSVELEKRGAEWKAVTFGNSAFATRLLETAPAGDPDWSVVTIPALNVVFRATGSGSTLQLTPVFDDTALGLRAGQTLPATDVLTALAIAAQNHNGEPR